MKDLKHLYFFEKLLDDANNELVRAAKDEGRVCVGSVCSLVPEVLLELSGTFTVRLRAPRTGSMEMGTYYLTSFLCEYSRALLERAIEGGYQFLDCLIAPDACAMINRAVENMELLVSDDTVKFVTGSQEDLQKAMEVIRTYDLTNRCHVYFSPVFGSIEPVQIVNFMLEHQLNDVRLQIQMHKIIWNPNERGV